MTVACVAGACQGDSQIILHGMVIEWLTSKSDTHFESMVPRFSFAERNGKM